MVRVHDPSIHPSYKLGALKVRATLVPHSVILGTSGLLLTSERKSLKGKVVFSCAPGYAAWVLLASSSFILL